MNEHSTGLPGGFSPLAYNNSGETKCFGAKHKTSLVSPQQAYFFI